MEILFVSKYILYSHSDMAALQQVQSFVLFGHTMLKQISKSVRVILVKFFKPALSSNLRSDSRYSMPPKIPGKWRQQHLSLLPLQKWL